MSSKAWLPPGIQKSSYCFSLHCRRPSLLTEISPSYATEIIHGLSGLLQAPALGGFAENVCLSGNTGSKIPDRNLPEYDEMQNASWLCFVSASGSFPASLWSKYWQRISPQKACFCSLKLRRIRSLLQSVWLSYIQKLNLVHFPDSACFFPVATVREQTTSSAVDVYSWSDEPHRQPNCCPSYQIRGFSIPTFFIVNTCFLLIALHSHFTSLCWVYDRRWRPKNESFGLTSVSQSGFFWLWTMITFHLDFKNSRKTRFLIKLLWEHLFCE